MKQNSFLGAFSKALLHHCHKVQTNNVDFFRFPPNSSSLLKKFRHRFLKGLDQLAILRFVLRQRGELENFYNLLQDESSRQLMVMLLVFRVLGRRRVKLPTNTPAYWKSVGKIEGLLKKSRTIPISTLNGYLDLYDLDDICFPIRLHAHPLNVLYVFLLQQYRYEKNGKVVQGVEPGDVVIDGGGCWGDATLYFAHKAGKDGKVYTFEFLPENQRIMRENMELNGFLKDRIQVVSEALWAKSGENLSYSEKGPASRLTPDWPNAPQVLTKSIDDFVEEQGLERIDFIKMDIEGAELKALQGAERTLRTYRPKLAISLYHRKEDFTTIPKYLDGLGLGYEFFLGHSTIYEEETVLFAFP